MLDTVSGHGYDDLSIDKKEIEMKKAMLVVTGLVLAGLLGGCNDQPAASVAPGGHVTKAPEKLDPPPVRQPSLKFFHPSGQF